MIRRYYKSYEEYLEHQKTKTLLIGAGKLPIASFEDRTVCFLQMFRRVAAWKGMKVLCLGARRGEEVAALLQLGADASGIDLVPHPPLVRAGDFHSLDELDNSFDAVYTNSLDHAQDPKKVASEAMRVLKPDGLFVAHVAFLPSKESVCAEGYEAISWENLPEVEDLCDGLLSSESLTLPGLPYNWQVIWRKAC